MNSRANAGIPFLGLPDNYVTHFNFHRLPDGTSISSTPTQSLAHAGSMQSLYYALMRRLARPEPV